MPDIRFRSGFPRRAHRRVVVVLWLALSWLPLAQGLAQRHMLAHLGGPVAAAVAGTPADDPAGLPHPAHCELCLTLAAADGLAPPAVPLAMAVGLFGLATPLARATTDAPATVPAFYASRAPPAPVA